VSLFIAAGGGGHVEPMGAGVAEECTCLSPRPLSQSLSTLNTYRVQPWRPVDRSRPGEEGACLAAENPGKWLLCCRGHAKPQPLQFLQEMPAGPCMCCRAPFITGTACDAMRCECEPRSSASSLSALGSSSCELGTYVTTVNHRTSDGQSHRT
jgi:hypothetical protein